MYQHDVVPANNVGHLYQELLIRMVPILLLDQFEQSQLLQWNSQFKISATTLDANNLNLPDINSKDSSQVRYKSVPNKREFLGLHVKHHPG